MNIDFIQDGINDLQASVMAYRRVRSKSSIKEIQSSLNKLFKQSECKDVMFTENTDKMFFGLNVFPILPAKEIYNILTSDRKYIIPNYYVEIDSKLIDSTLTDREVTACIVYDVAALVSDSSPIVKVRNLVNRYLVDTNSVIKKTDSTNYMELLSFGIRDTIRKLTSMFDIEPTIAIDSEFATSIGISNDIKEAIKKLRGELKLTYMNSNAESPIVVLGWVLRLYNSILKFRIPARHTIAKAIRFTGSELDRRELTILTKRLDRIDDFSVLREAALSDAMTEFKASGIRGYEDDYYELKFNANNLSTQDDALLLIGRINSRMSVLADYIGSEKNLSASNKARYTKLLNDYNTLRNKVSDEKVYENGNRIYVNYGFED